VAVVSIEGFAKHEDFEDADVAMDIERSLQITMLFMA
jgi:hypothetical protein